LLPYSDTELPGEIAIEPADPTSLVPVARKTDPVSDVDDIPVDNTESPPPPVPVETNTLPPGPESMDREPPTEFEETPADNLIDPPEAISFPATTDPADISTSPGSAPVLSPIDKIIDPLPEPGNVFIEIDPE